MYPQIRSCIPGMRYCIPKNGQVLGGLQPPLILIGQDGSRTERPTSADRPAGSLCLTNEILARVAAV